MLGPNSKRWIQIKPQHSYQTTVWKIHDFSIIRIVREINFEDSKSAKSVILTHLEAMNFDFYEFLHFLKGCNLPK